MTIYVEYIIIDNLVINTFILILTKIILHKSTTKIRIFLSALLGTITALISPLLPDSINNIIRIPLGVCMVMLAFKTENIKQLAITFSVFLICTFVFGGACYGIMQFLGIKAVLSNGINYTYSFPIGAVLLVCAVIFIATKNIALYLYQKRKHDKFCYEITLFDGSKKVVATAFLDTGNKLAYDGKAISIINFKTFNQLFPKISIADILLKKALHLKKEKYVQIQSIDGNRNSVLTFEIDKLCIEKTIVANAKLGLCLTEFNKKLNSDVIISPKILGD